MEATNVRAECKPSAVVYDDACVFCVSVAEEEGETETDATEGMEISTRSKGKNTRHRVSAAISTLSMYPWTLHRNIEDVLFCCKRVHVLSVVCVRAVKERGRGVACCVNPGKPSRCFYIWYVCLHVGRD